MAKKADTKQELLQTLTVKELQARLQDAEGSRFQLSFRHATTPLKNPMQLRQIRRNIARYKTILRQKAGVL